MLWRVNDERIAALGQRLTAAVEAFNRGDLDAAAAAFADDCRYQVAREHPESRVYEGLEEIKRYQRTWFAQLDEMKYEVAEVSVAWPYALVVGRITGRGSGSGVELGVDIGFLYELNDELEVTSVEEFLHPGDAQRRFEELQGASAAQ